MCNTEPAGLAGPFAHPFDGPLAALGPVRVVEAWGTGVLVRPVAGGNRHDAAAFPPLSAIAATADLPGGLAELRAAGLVAVVGVRDPHTAPPLDRFASAFDLCRPFKTHCVIDRAAGPPRFSDHHRARIRRARRRCTVAVVALADHLADWERLYGALAERHGITGPARLPPGYAARLARTEGVTAFAAAIDGAIVAMALWLRVGEVAHNHLCASDAAGYRAGASYALYDMAIAHFADCRIIELGGNAGLTDAEDGLALFKRGFANATAVAHLFGAVLDRPAYESLAAGRRDAGGYFPAYRAPLPAS